MPHTPLPPANRQRAKSMRRAITPGELKLWNALRAHRLMGMGFRRQFPVAGFIVDFACPEHWLVVEADGSGHGDDGQAAADLQRKARLEAEGWTVLRFWNDDMLREIEGVCRHVLIVAGLDRERHKPEGVCTR